MQFYRQFPTLQTVEDVSSSLTSQLLVRCNGNRPESGLAGITAHALSSVHVKCSLNLPKLAFRTTLALSLQARSFVDAVVECNFFLRMFTSQVQPSLSVNLIDQWLFS